MRPIRTIFAGLAFVLLGTGCLPGFRPSDRKNDRPPPEPLTAAAGKPTAEQLVGYLNKQAALLNSIESRDIDMDLRAQGSSVHLESGSLVCQKPRYFKLVGKKIGMQQFLAGSNDERFWVYINREDTLVHCSYTDYEKGAEMPIPFQPEWVLEALGMATCNPTETPRVEEDRTTYKLIEEATMRGQKVRKVTVFYKGTARDSQPQVVSRGMYDAATNKPIALATIEEVSRIPVDRGGSAAPAYAICPRVIKLEWPAQDTKMTIDLGRMKINGQVAVETFQMPRVGGKQIDLGRDRPTGRSVINPAGYR